MSHEIHPVRTPPGGTVPTGLSPYQPPRHRLRKVGAAVAAALALGAGGVAVAQGPLHSSHVATVFTASQNPDDDTTVPVPPQKPERSHVDGEGAGDD